MVPQTAKAQSTAEMITMVEGIAEFRLENGMKILLFPDQTKDTVTVNNTVFVGSRHEGYGEAGMAHLLEHMAFKGTPTFPNIPTAIRDHGAGRSMNGTTWLDRTNYFETMPSNDENLEFAIKLEADRMMNSLIRGEDLASEMTVVRNEFERGENSPHRILRQRITSTAYDWHNYGQSTIGNRADIERVPVQSLRRFYQKYYQPDNAMLVVSGSFHPPRAMEFAKTYFGAIPKPTRKLEKTYTEEPTQDGERLVTLRRVGDVAMVGVAYHIVSGPHPDFAATDILATSLVQAPSGRLYKELVETKLAARVNGGIFPTHDPNLVMYLAEVVQGVDSDDVAAAMLRVLESITTEPISPEEVERSRARLLKDWEQSFKDSQQVAVNLSDWASQGDWRLYFLYRDRLETAQTEDVQRIAENFLRRTNRTLGLFIPTEKPSRTHVPPTPDLAKMIGNYKGRQAVAMGEKFGVSPQNIERRTTRSTLNGGVKVVALPKKTRGSTVDVRLTLRFGDADSLYGTGGVTKLLGRLLMRGTEKMSRQQIMDALDKYRAEMSCRSAPGTLTCRIQAKRANLPSVLAIMADVLNHPAFPESELATLRQEYMAQYEQQLSDPQALSQLAVLRKLRPHESGDPRYVATIQETIDMIKEVTADDLRTLYETMITGKSGELTIVGDFDTDEVVAMVQPIVNKLNGTAAYSRLVNPPVSIPEDFLEISTPDKASATYFAGSVIPIRDDHENYPALVIGNDIFGGGGALASRLGDRVRQKDGLSYGVGSMMKTSAHDQRTELMIYAISNPQNVPKVRVAIREEMDRIRKDGITKDELQKAIASYIESQKVSRTNDSSLAMLLERNAEADRTMQFTADFEAKIRSLTVQQVNKAIRKYIDPKQLFIAAAGDFSK